MSAQFFKGFVHRSVVIVNSSTLTITENVTDVEEFTFLRDSMAGPSGALVLLDHSGHCV